MMQLSVSMYLSNYKMMLEVQLESVYWLISQPHVVFKITFQEVKETSRKCLHPNFKFILEMYRWCSRRKHNNNWFLRLNSWKFDNFICVPQNLRRNCEFAVELPQPLDFVYSRICLFPYYFQSREIGLVLGLGKHLKQKGSSKENISHIIPCGNSKSMVSCN